MRQRFVWTLAVTAVLVLLAPPAAAQLELPDAPVGGSSGIDCIPICIIDQAGASCESSANTGGTITELSAEPPFFVFDFRRGPAPIGSSNACAGGTADPVTLPANLNPGQVLFFDLSFQPTVPGTHHGAVHVEGQSGSNTFSNDFPVVGEATGGDPTASCFPGPNVLCLNDDRFKVETSWRTDQGTSGAGNVVPFQTDDSGIFWFFRETNLEVVIKVIDGCTVNDRFWVFAGGLTNVEVQITVTDTQTGIVNTYENPLNAPFQPIQDTNAFATCP